MSIRGRKAKVRAGARLILVFTGVLALLWLAAGCGSSARPVPGPGQPPENGNQPPISAGPKDTPVKVTLYFSDSQADKLVPEEREVAKKGDYLEKIIVEELIKGPTGKGMLKTIPESARLLSLSVVDGVAYVNFSQEIQTKHWGGSAGETMTVYSVVNSLARLEGIKKVQFLVEGKKVESLLGHMDTSEPLAPNLSLIKQ
ncbi:MAG: GerMN domain-containing protein [Peptococcaceae bacterium]|nr:GerMN domain-containing protein [Peptococcaceae bacterium]